MLLDEMQTTIITFQTNETFHILIQKLLLMATVSIPITIILQYSILVYFI